jgi:acyl-CoA thioester hydrolase
MHEIEYEFQVPFHDVDPMNIVWHGRYVKYLEVARCKLLEVIDYDYQAMYDSGFAWPVVDMRIKYIRPLKFNQIVVIHCSIKEWENRLKVVYTIRDKATGEKLNSAYTIQVAIDMQTEEMCYESPDILFEKIGVART